ncbi:MAG: sensor histidine kinase [Chloroflexota bacterium]|nr:sensor histidine kinase [Chloroflexota bacterium]
MANFFQTNRDIVFFVYGEAFFVLGLAAALQSRKHSQLGLAEHLWLLAIFGIVHGIYEWGAVFIPIQQTYLNADAVNLLRLIQLGLEAISFLALFQFGVELTALGLHRPRRRRILPTAMLLVWMVSVFALQTLTGDSFAEFLDIGDSTARYLLAVPGAIAAAWGLWIQAEQVNRMELSRIATYFRGAAYAFGIYAATCAIVPRGDFFPASVINYTTVLNTIGIPVAVFRAICGMLIAYLIIRGLEIFDVETDRLLEEATQTRAVSADRERIGRDLHDGIIQSLYAAGLTLEDASLTIDDNPPRAKDRIGEVIHALNRTIRDIRTYILDLRRESDSGNWVADLGELARAFRLQTLIETEFRVEGTPRAALPAEQGKEIVGIAREAMTNTARHARATRIQVRLIHRRAAMELEIADNGIGFSRNGDETAPLPGEHQGLQNMQTRAEIVGGELTIDSAPGHGTVVRLVVPLTKN